MDPNPILFVFMILFLTFLTNDSTALEYDGSSLTQEYPWKRGLVRYSNLVKVHHKLRRSKKSKLYKSTSNNENLSTKNMETFVTENTEDTPKSVTGSVPKDKVTGAIRNLAKESDPKSIRRDSRDYFNDNSDTVTVEQYTTDVTNNDEETSTPKPRKRSRKSRRKMKKNKNKIKKYKTQFKITKIKNKKRNKGRRIKTELPDIVEAILNESQEMYLETLPALPTKRTKIIKSTKEKRRKGKKSKKHSNHIGDGYERRHNKGGGWQKLTYRKKKAGKSKHPKKKHHIILTTTLNTEDYLETVNSEEVEETTKHMHKTNDERTEIIYVTPVPNYKKYKPEFRYIRIDSEPLIYGNLHTRNSEMARSSESDTSKSVSKETEEPDSSPKEVTNWAEAYKLGSSPEENHDEEDVSDTTESSETSSTETDESDHDHDSLKIRRTADDQWFDLEGDKVKYPNNIKDNYRVKKSKAVSDIPHKTKIVLYKNYHKKKSDQGVAERKDKPVSSYHNIIGQQPKTITTKRDIEEEQDKTVSANHRTELTMTNKTKSHLSILEDRLSPVLEYGIKKNNTGQEKKPAKRFTPSDDILMITFEEDQTSRYEPSVHYKSHYRRLRKKLFGRKSKTRSTRNIMKLPTFTEVMAVHDRVTAEHSSQFEDIHKEIIENSTINDSSDSEPRSTEVVTEKPRWRYEPVIEFVPVKNSFRGQTQDDEETREIQDPLIEKYETHFDESKHYDNSPEQTHVKRSTLHETVKVVKISHVKIKKKRRNFLTTNQPEETTPVEDYGDTNTETVKETERTPNRYSNTYQVHENVIDVPDNRHIPGPVIPNYVVTSNHKITISPNMTNKLGDFNPYNGPAEIENTEHPIVNIVHSMKDYFTVIGKGLYNTVKDIFKEQTRRRRALESQESYYIIAKY